MYWSNLALCYDKLECIVEFKDAALKCVELDPTFVKGYYRLARAHYRVWEYEEEEKVLETAISIDATNNDLYKMLWEVKRRIEYRKMYDTVILEGPITESDATTLAYFGGLPASHSGECKLPQNTAYSKLKRCPLPPLSNKYKNLSQYDSKVRPVFKSFFNGTLKIEWLWDPVGTLHVDGFIPGERVPVISYYTHTKLDDQSDSLGSFSQFTTKQNTKYQNTLTISEKNLLKVVMMQRFLRVKGAQININRAALTDCIDNLAKECIDERLYKDCADLHLINADISFNRGFHDFNFKVIRVAEDLEAAKRYQEAGALYSELTNSDLFKQDPWMHYSILHGYSGLAFKRAQDYISAEREYIAALRAAGADWPSKLELNSGKYHDDLHINEILANTMIFYEIAHRAVLSGLKTDDAHIAMQYANHQLIGLLSIAGYNHGGNTLFDTPHFVYQSQSLLKPEYKTKDRALQAIAHATMAPTIKEYHDRLFNCVIYDGINFENLNTPAQQAKMRADLLKDQAKKSKDASREAAHDTTNNRSWKYEDCDGCRKSYKPEKLKECSCHTVKYCSVECQRSHWKQIHKMICPLKQKE